MTSPTPSEYRAQLNRIEQKLNRLLSQDKSSNSYCNNCYTTYDSAYPSCPLPMTPLRFRAWHKTTREMMRFDLAELFEDSRSASYPSYAQTAFTDLIWMQSTGLKDKNGKEIFEGDIVSFDGNMTADNTFGLAPNGWHYDGDSKYAIEWSQEWAAWQPAFTKEDQEDEFFYKYRNHTRNLLIDGHCEVIGNIYENPNLLK